MMKPKPTVGRRSIRLKDFDYSQSGAYFITICVEEKKCVLGDVIEGEMQLNELGKIVEEIWEKMPERFPFVELDGFVVMPNHFHGILFFKSSDARGAASSAPTLGNVMRAFKSISGILANRALGQPGKAFWQRNYFERVIRNEKELDKIREYIINNPLQWEIDREHPENFGEIFKSNG